MFGGLIALVVVLGAVLFVVGRGAVEPIAKLWKRSSSRAGRSADRLLIFGYHTDTVTPAA